MKLAIFAKRMQSKEGKQYAIYLTTLQNRVTGEEIKARVKFREGGGVPKPDNCPMNIIVSKENANLVTSKYTIEDTGEERLTRVLWVGEWSEGEPYVDHSLDEYE